MTDRESLDLNWGRWLLWGVLAIAVLVAVTLFFINLGDDIETTAGEQVEWSIVASEYTPSPGTVTLKGGHPVGLPHRNLARRQHGCPQCR